MLNGGLKSVLVAVALAGSLSAVACGPAFAGKRMALVIGNAAYRNVPALRNPINDARGVKEALEKIGFQAELVTDVDYRSFAKRLNDFSRRAADADAVLFYYAGHGVEENKTGYLLPTDIDADDLRNPEVSQVPSIDLVASALAGARGPKILIVDACREDPNSHDITVGGDLQVRNVATRSVNDIGEPRTASEPARDEGMLIVFSTAAKAVAYDGSGTQGPFAASLIRHLSEAGLTAADLFHEVNADVQAETNNQQRTSFYDSLRSAYKLNLGVNDDELAWQKLSGNNDATADDYDAFVGRFPASAHASDAQRWRNMLRRVAKEREEERGAAGEAQAWDDAVKANTADGYSSFIGSFSKSTHVAEAAQRRDRLAGAAAEAKAWDKVVADGAAEAFDKFLGDFPASPHKADALRLRDEASAWALASKDGSAEALEKFAQRFPHSPHKDDAVRLRDQVRAVSAEAAAWTAANRDRTTEAFEKFALNFPRSTHKAEALQLADQLREAAAEDAAWKAAQRDNSQSEFDQFATVFPNSPHRAEAGRRRDDLRAASLAAQEKLAWANAIQAGGVEALDAFIDQFPHSARVADARRRIGELKAVETAKADAEVKAETCRREGEALSAKLATHADPTEFEALLSVSSCAAQRPAIEQALAEAKKAKLAAACATDRATLAGAGADAVAVQAGMAGMTCEPARQEAKVVLARLQAQEAAAKKQADAAALAQKKEAEALVQAQRTCDAAGRDLDAIDLYAEPARDRIVALRDKSGCADPAFVARASEKLDAVAAQVSVTQHELGRIGCYSGVFTGQFDAATKSSLSAYFRQIGGGPEPVSLRVSPELLEILREQAGAVCGAGAVAKIQPQDATAVAKATEEAPPPARPTVAPVAPKPPTVIHQLKPPVIAHIAPRPQPEEDAPERRAPPRKTTSSVSAQHEAAPRPALERRAPAQPASHPYASSAPAAPRAASSPSAPQIMIIPN